MVFVRQTVSNPSVHRYKQSELLLGSEDREWDIIFKNMPI